MSTIEKISYNISNKLGTKSNKTKDEIEIINYGLFMTIHTIIGIIATILVGIILGVVKEILIISLIASSLKRYSGGVHATSPNRCLIIGLIVSVIFTYVSLFFIQNVDLNKIILISFINLSICYFIFYKNAPVGTKNKPLKKESTRTKLRKKLFKMINIYYIFIGILIMCIYLDIINYKYIYIVCCVELGVLIQCISLTKLGEYTILKLDSILTYKKT